MEWYKRVNICAMYKKFWTNGDDNSTAQLGLWSENYSEKSNRKWLDEGCKDIQKQEATGIDDLLGL